MSIIALVCLVSGQDICHVQGICQNGYHLGNIVSNSYTDCQLECQNTLDCNYFTYNDPNNICVLQYNCTEIDSSNCLECFTGQRGCLVCSQSGQCQGNLVGQAISETEEDCQEACFNDDDCLWYTFDFQASLCLLTSDCVPVNSSSLKVYGEKNCFIQNGDGTNPSKVKYRVYY